MKYKKPKIMRIELDPKQALLQVCAVGGIYIESQPGNGGLGCVGAGGTDVNWFCATAVRGRGPVYSQVGGRFNSAPS